MTPATLVFHFVSPAPHLLIKCGGNFPFCQSCYVSLFQYCLSIPDPHWTLPFMFMDSHMSHHKVMIFLATTRSLQPFHVTLALCSRITSALRFLSAPPSRNLRFRLYVSVLHPVAICASVYMFHLHRFSACACDLLLCFLSCACSFDILPPHCPLPM